MQYEIQVEETVTRFNRYTVEVESEEEGDTRVKFVLWMMLKTQITEMIYHASSKKQDMKSQK